MAEVYKAYQANLDRYVAIKLMHAFLAADQDFISRFEREAKNVAALRHPNIVQVFDFDVHNGTPYMVMEYGGRHPENPPGEPDPGGKALPLASDHIIREVGRACTPTEDDPPRCEAGQRDARQEWPGDLTDFGIAKILTAELHDDGRPSAPRRICRGAGPGHGRPLQTVCAG
jgi:hypothetical protein